MEPKRKSNKIIGVFEGECADAEITNENGLDIKRRVWELVFASEEYKRAIDMGWYIGFLGHPEDPGCMDFEHGCIVMTEGHIDADGKVFGKFNLIDTPVGRIVKAFIDAGVTFGISVRGAGDIINNSVDPETFVFRGFDLVAFPAFPESVPVFTEIAASTNVDDRRKYKAICAAIQEEVPNITDNRTLGILQSQFASQSAEYKMIESQMNKGDNIIAEKLAAMTDMYIEATSQLHKLAIENERLRIQASHDESVMRRKSNAMERITASQLNAADKDIEAIDAQLQKSINANKQLRHEISILNTTISQLKHSNLKYEQAIQSAENSTQKYERIISSKNSKLDETVRKLREAEIRASNLDDKIMRLNERVVASEEMCNEYRNAYAQLYGGAAGVDISNLDIKAGMSLDMLKTTIHSCTTVPTTVSRDIQAFEVSEFNPAIQYDENDIVTM